MSRQRKIMFLAVLTALVFAASAVASEGSAEFPVYNITVMTSYLRDLPQPKDKIPVAVYQVADKTGQRLEMGDYSSMSTAVSQGATEMLIQALINAGQFKVADRSILQWVITEQDLRGQGRLAADEQEPQTNQLMGSRYIITGAVTEYGLARTGGTKLKIEGKGGSAQGAVAYAAIDLRVIDSTTNEVAYAISLRDDIKGVNIGGDIFSFLGKNLLVDFEAGTSWQEPISLVVRRLIEAGVYDMSVNFFASQTGIESDLDSVQVDAFNRSLAEGKTAIDWETDSANRGAAAFFMLLFALGLSQMK